jgi:predicted Ser/Thr protein kinase
VVDDDVLLGELIVRAGILSREGIARALIEVSRRRSQGVESDLGGLLVSAGLLDRDTLERCQREARSRPARDEELSKALRNAYDSVDDTSVMKPGPKPTSFPAIGALPVAPPLPAKKTTGRLEPQPPASSTNAVLPAVGRTWGPYEILIKVASGAMGAVYRAKDLRRGGQEVALKVLLQGNKADLEDVERFQREARSLKRLNHPAIVRFYDYGVHEGCPFVAMDFVAGTTFESIMTGGSLPIEKGIVILEEVARAVDHAHSHGVVHRDLKPANVLIGADGRARITDFGLAKILDEGTNLTRSGDLIGTPLYMSPEQIRGDLAALGPSSDVWSLGVTLYLLLTGQQPFGAKTIDEVALRVKNEEPIPPRKLKPELAPELEQIVLAALTKDPRQRYQSAGEFSNDLRSYLHGKPVLAGRVTLKIRLRRFARSVKLRLGIRPLIGMVLALLLAFGSVGIYSAHSRKDPALAFAPAWAKLVDLRELVVTLADPRSDASPIEAARSLEGAHRAVVDSIPPGPQGAEIRRECDNLRARGHMLLALRVPSGGDASAWAASQLLAAAEYASDLVPAPGSVQTVDRRTALEHAMDPLSRVHDRAAREKAWALVDKMGKDAAGPFLTARAASLAGDWPRARAVIESALESGSLASGEHDAALDLELEALLGLEANEMALERASGAAAEASTQRGPDAVASELRLAQLELVGVRALRAIPRRAPERLAVLGRVEGRLAALDRRRPAPSIAGVASLTVVHDALHLERAYAAIDAGMPAAALHELDRLKDHEHDPRTAIARARAHLLAGDEAAIPGDRSRLLEVLAAPGVTPAAAADAALALDDMSVLSPPSPADAAAIAALADLHRVAASGDGKRGGSKSWLESARRATFALAAPQVARAVRALAQEWARPQGGEFEKSQERLDATDACAVLEPLAAAGDLEAESWLLVLSHADPGRRGASLDQLGKAVSASRPEDSGSDVARLAHAIDAIVSRPRLAAALWDESTGEAKDSGYKLTARVDVEKPGTNALVGVANDKIALVRARLPFHSEATTRDVAAHRAEHEKLLDSADRILELAVRRDPFSRTVRRARAQLELARAQVTVASGVFLVDAHRALLPEAAAAVLLDPFDVASTAALARNFLAWDMDAPDAKVWATRSLEPQGRGQRSEVETALLESVVTPSPPVRDAPLLELRSWLALTAGQPTLARFDEVAALRRGRPELPAQRAAGAAHGWAAVALTWESAADEAFNFVPPGGDDGPGDRDAADSLLRGVRHVLACEAALGRGADGAGDVDPRAELVLARSALTDALERRPDSVTPRIFLDYARALAGLQPDVLEAKADLERLRPILAARAQRFGPEHPFPALVAAAAAIAQARLVTPFQGVIKVMDERTARLLNRAECRAALARWKQEAR